MKFYCDNCGERTRADTGGMNPDCSRCGEPYSCGECGFEIDDDGNCLRAKYNAGECDNTGGQAQ